MDSLKACGDCIHFKACSRAFEVFGVQIEDFIECCELFSDNSSVIKLPVALDESIYYVLGKNFVTEHKVRGAYYTPLENEMVIVARSNDGRFNALNKFHIGFLGKLWFVDKKEAIERSKKGMF